MANRAIISVHASPETSDRLDLLAKATQRSRSFLANAAIERYLEEEEQFLAAVASGRQDLAEGKSQGHDVVKDWISSLTSDQPQSKPKR